MRSPVMQGNQTPQNGDYQPRQECGREQNGYIEVHDVRDNSAVNGRCRCASAMSAKHVRRDLSVTGILQQLSDTLSADDVSF